MGIAVDLRVVGGPIAANISAGEQEHLGLRSQSVRCQSFFDLRANSSSQGFVSSIRTDNNSIRADNLGTERRGHDDDYGTRPPHECFEGCEYMNPDLIA